MAEQLPNDRSQSLTRRRFVLSLAASFGLGAVVAAEALRLWERHDRLFGATTNLLDQVIPSAGSRTSTSFGESVRKLIAAGAIDPQKFRSTLAGGNALPDWVEQHFLLPATEPILLDLQTAPYLLNLLWPLGLSTKAKFNETSPINTDRLPSFASTAGWTLGREPNGAAYFNKIDSFHLTGDQEAMVEAVAQSTFRPCCDNSTLFQDCNHGSALLGLIELAASQAADLVELYRVALAANSYWFPDQYTKTALYFALFENRDWHEVPPAIILGARFSSLNGWQNNVLAPLQRANYFSAVGQMGQGKCAV